MRNTLLKLMLLVVAVVSACKPATKGGLSEVNMASAGGAIVALVGKNGSALTLTQLSRRSLRPGIVCRYPADSESRELRIVPSTLARISSTNGLEYFVKLKSPMPASECQSSDDGDSDFDYISFYVSKSEVEVLTSATVTPEPGRELLPDSGILTSRKAESLARDIETRRSGGNKACGLTSFGQRGCWGCVGWSMTAVKLFPSGLGSGADASPNGFLRATAAARSRKSADGTIDINGVRFRSLRAQYGSTPSLAPRGSILFCNTSAEGHAAIITKTANEMRSDVVEILGATWRQSACWERVDEILFPLD
ncbi:MAG: hypothetical protein FJY29_12685 [Betaproteobacteria bacterium]|nr:hypothetical protein [Betaproteobacteria bacterium]